VLLWIALRESCTASSRVIGAPPLNIYTLSFKLKWHRDMFFIQRCTVWQKEATRMSFKLTRGDALPWRLTALSLRTIATVVYAQPRRALPTELHDPHHKIRRGPGCRGSVRRVVPVRVDSAELESGDTQGSPWPVLEQTVTFACPARAPCILPASALRCVHEPGRCLL